MVTKLSEHDFADLRFFPITKPQTLMAAEKRRAMMHLQRPNSSGVGFVPGAAAGAVRA
jgi:hypothetical protein